METKYTSSNLKKCIEKACKELKTTEECLNYKVIEEKKGFFSKKITIKVQLKKENNIDTNEINESKKDSEQKEENKISKLKDKDGTIKVEENKIIVKNPKEEGNPAIVTPSDKMKILIDGEEIKSKTAIYEENEVEIEFEEEEAKRHLDITLKDNNMKAFISIKYEPKITYKLENSEEVNKLILKEKIVEKVYPPKYTSSEIKGELGKKGIIYGIIDKNIQICEKNNCDDILIAEGSEAVEGINDKIDIKFKTDRESLKLQEDKEGNVDFKSIGSIESVKIGDVIAERVPGKAGKDGKDVKGKIKKHTPCKKLILKTGQGVTLKGENTIIATIEGKPCIKSNVFYVYKVHEIKGDVDLNTGNIKFIGDVIVFGTVKEGMKIEAGNSIDIQKNVERSKLKSKGNINIKGNIIASEVNGGGEDIIKLKVLENLAQLKKILLSLMKAVEEIKRFNILGEDKKDGEIIKALIENKFKTLTKTCISLMTNINIERRNGDKENELVGFIRKKLLGISPVNIKYYGELDEIVKACEEEEDYYKQNLNLPVNINLSYCQDSTVESTGNIYVTGKGEYVSTLVSNDSIYFSNKESVARGGCIKAKNEIKCSKVGSSAGVSTRIEVSRKGHIYTDLAYQNTLFVVGGMEYLLEAPSKDIHAYLNSKGELFVDKFKL
ncbi:FapA family protein [Clostridium oceanicum]|uniref:FapA family protein n=1 Tax=Clostridium oceanicum TaxID=1543 RepID=A0ABN1JU41_9CLOT